MNTSNFVSIVIDGQSLLLPKNEVGEIVPIDNIPATGTEVETWFIEHQNRKYPVYIIDSELAPLDKCPEQRQFVVCFEKEQRLLCVACDMVNSVQFVSNYLFEKLPDMMKLPNSPIQALLYADKHLHLVTAAAPLVDFLINQERCT